MIYTHPYKRGLSAWCEYDGFISVGLLLWKWEVRWNCHSIGPGIDYVQNRWKRDIAAHAARADAAEASLRERLAEEKKDVVA